MTTQAHDPERLRLLLFPPDVKVATPVYAVLDGARSEHIHERIVTSGLEARCLYRGELAPVLARAAPWLVRLEKQGTFSDWLLSEGWGRAFGIFVVSIAPIDGVARHLRGFLRVKGPRGEGLLFRYYDPRVARVYLPTMNAEEARIVCGSLTRLIVESEDGLSATEWVPVRGEVPRQLEHDVAQPLATRTG